MQSDDIPLSWKRIGALTTVIVTVLFTGFGINPLFAQGPVEVAHAPEADEHELDEILWLARAVYSETKVRGEQELVAWVIRNRVESAKYPDTYEGVVRARGQFSGLHPTDRQYDVNVSREYTDTGHGWDSALEIAEDVYFAQSTERPIDAGVTHFYSPISVVHTPDWAQGEPAHVVKDTERGYTRFAFYANVK